MFSVGKNIFYKSDQVSTWPGFDKGPHTICVHRLNRFSETYRPNPLLRCYRARFFGVARERRGRRTGVRCDLRCDKPQLPKELAQLLANRRKQRCVIGSAERQWLTDDTHRPKFV